MSVEVDVLRLYRRKRGRPALIEGRFNALPKMVQKWIVQDCESYIKKVVGVWEWYLNVSGEAKYFS